MCTTNPIKMKGSLPKRFVHLPNIPNTTPPGKKKMSKLETEKKIDFNFQNLISSLEITFP